MKDHIQASKLPVLLISDQDPAWPFDEYIEAVQLTERIAFELQSLGHPLVCIQVREDNLPDLLSSYSPDAWIVFNWCESIPGIPHSSADVAKTLEQCGFTYTGAHSSALALSQHKPRVKKRLEKNGILTPIWQVVARSTKVNWSRFPAIVKPAYEHSSYGITREAVVQTAQELLDRINYVHKELKQPALVEEFIDGREFHVGVIGNRKLQVLQPAEIDFSEFPDIHDRLITYESNFDKCCAAYKRTVPKLPAELTLDQIHALEQMVIDAYRATGCRDYARMDIRMRDDTFFVLDVNHNADICPDNSLLRAAELAGYSYVQFCSLLIRFAAERHPIYGNKAPKILSRKIGEIT